jgi:thiol:disulfide interchange protein
MQTFPLIILGAIVATVGGVWLFGNSDPVPTDRTEATPATESVVDESASPVSEPTGVSTAETPNETEAEAAPVATSGLYADYSEEHLARAADGPVVLFFSAAWCPTCRALDRDITANQATIPAGVTILQVDYDSAVTLRQQYGVTTQHTLVQVDAAGNELKQWSGSTRLSDLLTEV